MIEWAGVRSDDLGIVVEHYPKPIIPERQQSTQTVSGRNGDILFSTRAFKNYNQPYEIFMDSKYKGGLEVIFPKVVDWLMGNEGYQRLEDSYFPEYYRLAYYSGGAEFLTMFNEYGQGTLTFNCNPCKYFKSGEKEVSVANYGKLYNPSAFTATPFIKFKTKDPYNRSIHANNTYVALQINDRPSVVIDVSGCANGTEICIDVAKHTVTKSAPGSTAIPLPHNIIESDSVAAFVQANKWYEFDISNGAEQDEGYTNAWDYNTVLPNQGNESVHIAEGHLQQTVYNISPTESVDYELVDGHLILKVQSMNTSTYGSFEDLVLKKGASQFALSNCKDLIVIPRWWTI